mgnify:CR=1
MNKYTVLVLFCINIQKGDGVGARCFNSICLLLMLYLYYNCAYLFIGRFAL